MDDQLRIDDLVGRFQATFSRLGPGVDMRLGEIYAESIVFADPAHEIQGLEALSAYFDRLNSGLREGRFHFGLPVVGPLAATLPWTMALHLRRPAIRVEVAGISHLEFSGGEFSGSEPGASEPGHEVAGLRVQRQRDYFDLGALLYEQVPVLGSLIRAIKRRFAA